MKTALKNLAFCLCLLALFTSCDKSTEKQNPNGTDSTMTTEGQPAPSKPDFNDRELIPFEKAGIIKPDLSEEKLIEVMGADKVRDEVVFEYEGVEVKGSEVSFEKPEDVLTIEWTDSTHTKPYLIRIEDAGSSWKTKEGIHTGMSIAEVEKLNGKPFKIYGFEIDYYLAGKVQSWEGGKLEGLDLQFEMSKELSPDDQMQVMGDGGILSNDEYLAKAELKVGTILLQLNKLQ